jgi:hypothetical protein
LSAQFELVYRQEWGSVGDIINKVGETLQNWGAQAADWMGARGGEVAGWMKREGGFVAQWCHDHLPPAELDEAAKHWLDEATKDWIDGARQQAQAILDHTGQVLSDEAAKHDPHLEQTPVGRAVAKAVGLGLTGPDDTILVDGF